MTGVNRIDSLQYLLGIEGSSPTGPAGIPTSVSGANSGISGSDTVSLSRKSLELAETIFGSLPDILSGRPDDPGSSMYDVLLSASNAKILARNPGLVKMASAVNEAETSGPAKGIDLFAMNSRDILSILDKYRSLSG
jgi:hypothetical protein